VPSWKTKLLWKSLLAGDGGDGDDDQSASSVVVKDICRYASWIRRAACGDSSLGVCFSVSSLLGLWFPPLEMYEGECVIDSLVSKFIGEIST